jgi:hypothetical protein
MPVGLGCPGAVPAARPIVGSLPARLCQSVGSKSERQVPKDKDRETRSERQVRSPLLRSRKRQEARGIRSASCQGMGQGQIQGPL